MNPFHPDEAMQRLLREDRRYDAEAYVFVREALDESVTLFRQEEKAGAARHVSGRELLEAFRRLALDRFGPLAARVLRAWGLTRTGDVGNIVFRLIEIGVLGKTDEDRIEDFEEVFDFEEAFLAPFRPADRPVPPATETESA